jgi:hypothetical protein
MHHVTVAFVAILILLTVGCNQSLLDEINTTGAANFDAACINVTRQVEARCITMFAVVPVDPSTKDIDGYHIEVVANPALIKNHKKFYGAYHNHHNSLVLNFAAVQVLEGNRDLGLYLMRTLARIDPSYEWSHPKLRNRSIKRILQGVEANDGSMQDFLQDEKFQWETRTRKYGMLKRDSPVTSLRLNHETTSTNNEQPDSPSTPDPLR